MQARWEACNNHIWELWASSNKCISKCILTSNNNNINKEEATNREVVVDKAEVEEEAIKTEVDIRIKATTNNNNTKEVINNNRLVSLASHTCRDLL
jgi:hypothetical protein